MLWKKSRSVRRVLSLHQEKRLFTYPLMFSLLFFIILQEIEAEMGRTQKNKATNYHLGTLKAKLAKLRNELLIESSGGGGGGRKLIRTILDVL